MSISIFNLFKVGIGPSSSHTVGPMHAACDFVAELKARDMLTSVDRLEVQLYGSLSATGIGHGTDRAVIMGLMGERPDHINPDIIDSCIEEVRESEWLRLDGKHSLPFLWARDMQLFEESLPHHPNAMRLIAHAHGEERHNNTYYSVGGGFIIDAVQAARGDLDDNTTELPYNIQTGDDLMRLCRKSGLRISKLMLENEKTWRAEVEIRDNLLAIWAAMQDCVKIRPGSRAGTAWRSQR